jgi:hypothetical protein
MRMSELVSSMGLSIFPIVGIIAFGLAFLFVLARVIGATRNEVAHNASIPLEDGSRSGLGSNHTPATQPVTQPATGSPRAADHGSHA